jgi:microsomal dipeptidase-like Zn-dependent dipeptidase
VLAHRIAAHLNSMGVVNQSVENAVDDGLNGAALDGASSNHPRRIYDLTDGLIRRKYTDEHIRLILGENWRRVLSGIWTPIA